MSVFLAACSFHTDSLHLVVGIFIALPSSSPHSLTALNCLDMKTRERGVRSQKGQKGKGGIGIGDRGLREYMG